MNLTIFGLPNIVELRRFSVPFSRRNSLDSLGRYSRLHLSSLDIVEDINPPHKGGHCGNISYPADDTRNTFFYFYLSRHTLTAPLSSEISFS